MRRLLLASALALFGAALLASPALRARAQAGGPPSQGVVPSLTEPGEGLAILRTSPESGRAAFAASRGRGILLPGTEAAGPADRASAFIDHYGPAFGLESRLDVRLSRAPKRDALGFEHVRFQQLHQGVPVTGAEFLVHLRGNRAMAANGRVLTQMPADLTPTVPAPSAQTAARDYIAREKAALATAASYGQPRLEIFNRGFLEHTPGTESRLAWFVEATGVDLREFIWIDAQTGALLLAFSQLETARNRQVYNASGTSTLPGTLARSEADPPTGDSNVDNAFNLSGFAYNYFFNNHARDSYDGAGATIVSTANWNGGGTTCPNAFWNGTQLVFCTNTFGKDIVGHEFTHAVTQNEANLFYWGLSGALNESFSDIFGETMDLLPGTDPPADRWKIGENTSIGVVRNMMSPGDFFDPARLSEFFFPANPPTTNSGVPNHAYALMVDGGTYNNRTITGIGLVKAAQVQYRALTTYLTTSSDFFDDYQAVNQSCSDLIGTSGITASDCAQVNEAMLAVEMNGTISGQVPAVPLCPAGGTPTYTFREGFETGAPGWTVSPASPARWGLQSLFVDAGAFSARGLTPGVTSDHSFTSASFVVPTGGRMMFRHMFEFSQNQGGGGWLDGGVLEYTTNGGTTWLDALVPQPPVPPAPPPPAFGDRGLGYNGFLSDSNPIVTTSYSGRQGFIISGGAGYQPTRLNLAPIAGQTVRFRWRIGTASSAVTNGWFLDQVDVYSCTVTAGAPAITVQPVGAFALPGGNRTFTVTATGTPTLRYQWLKNGFPIQGATSSSLAFTNIQHHDYGTYSVMISNDIGTATSDSAILFGGEGTPSIRTQPLGRTITAGQTTTFFASADTDFDMSYQWQLSTNGGATWNPVPNSAPYSGVTTTTLTITAATLGLSNTRYRLAATWSGSGTTALSRAALLTVVPADLMTNGTFATGDTTGWQYFESPAGSGQRQVTAGVFEWNRPGNSSTQSVLFQNTGTALSGPIAAQFDLGNSANIRQRVSVLIIDSDFSDITVCTFWLAPAAPMRTYHMRTHTTKAWTNAAIYFYAATTATFATNGGYLRLDNVSVGVNSLGSSLHTECEDPTAPAPPGGADSASLLTNGTFAAGTTGWNTFGVITSQVSNGVFEYIRPSPGPATPAGVVFQATGAAVAANEFLTATFELGNSSAIKKRVTALILSSDFSDLAACTFWLPAGMPLSPYQMKMRATKAWAAGASTGAALYFYAATVGSDRWIRLDNAVLKRTPGAAVAGTECLEPVEVQSPPFFAPSGGGATSAAPLVPAGAPVFDEAAVSQVLALPGGDAGRILRLPSGLVVQVSLDGVTWDTIAEVPPGEPWADVDIDLSEYAGRTINVQFLYNTGEDRIAVWRVMGLRVARRD